MYDIAPEVVSIADSCLGSLRDRSALLVGPREQRYPFVRLLRQANMKDIYEEEHAEQVSPIIPRVQLLICIPSPAQFSGRENAAPILTAATIARGCEGRRTPLLIFDLAPTTSVEELAGLLPTVCLYTPQDLRHVLAQQEVKAS